MTLPPLPLHGRVRFGLFALAPILLLLVLFVVLPPDGLERAASAQFLGRFHLLTVHFPIALILIVPLLELAGSHPRFPHLRASVDFVWGLAMLSSLAAAALGWCLAWSGGYSGRLVTQHMWGGLFVSAACCVCWMLRGNDRGPHLDSPYPWALLLLVGLVSFTGYRGGQLSQGENHLTEEMPRPLRRLIGLPVASPAVPRSDPAFFYGAHVEPIFAEHCYACHSADKQKGNLRLDRYDLLMRGGKHGAVLKAGNAKGSELFRRITLPASDDDAMPPQGKRPLSANELKVLELWIAAGASATLPADGIKQAPTAPEPAATEVTFEEVDADAVTQARAPFAAQFAQLKQRFPDALEYESRNSAKMVIDASALGPRFGDANLAALQPLSEQIVVADFSGTAITDASAGVLAGMKHARVLRLGSTRISDGTVARLDGLDQLQSLDLYGTAVTPACLKTAERLPRLRRVYVGATRIPASLAPPDALQGKLLF